MKQKGRRSKLTSLLLAFAMTIGCLSGPVFVKQTAEAATDTIELGTLKNNGTYYSYPDASVRMTGAEKKFYDLTVMVDSGYFKLPQSKLDATKAIGILPDGGAYELTIQDQFTEVTTINQYSAIMFSWASGTTKANLEDFIQRIQFVTESAKSQVVSMSATTIPDTDKKVTVGNQTVTLKYFNGHFYGYVGDWTTWSNANSRALNADFHGIKGYLATITSRAEDRFILTNWKSDRGWIGCTRAKKTDDSSYDSADIQFKTLDTMAANGSNAETDFIWRWVTGPEAGHAFGYQNQVGGNGHDGGFQVYAGEFANWQNDTAANKVEPNGGGTVYNQDEAYGYYGEYPEGRWNDQSATFSTNYYIEFGGRPGDQEKLKENMGEVIYSAEKDSDTVINDGTADKIKLSGDVYIQNNDPYDVCRTGTELEADILDILESNTALGVTASDLTYQWLRQDKNGVPTIIEGATSKTYNLKEEDLGLKIIVRATVTKTDSEGNEKTHMAESDPYNTSTDVGKNKITIGGSVAVKEIDKAANDDPILEADITGITPDGAQPVLDYQWYIYDPAQNEYTPIEGANDKTYKVPAENQGKQIAVTVWPDDEKGEDYEGSVTSLPYTVTDKNTPKEPIKGVVLIENQTKDDNGNDSVREGSILSANVEGVDPAGAQPTLTYQWFVSGDDGTFSPIPGAVYKNYELKETDIDRQIAVTVYGDEVTYTGSVSSQPYDADRTNADINVDPGTNPDDPNLTDGKRVIKVTPSAKSTGYTVWEFITQQIPEDLVVTDAEGNPLTPDEEGYYANKDEDGNIIPGGEIWFYVDKDKSYDIKEKQVVNQNTETLGIHIDDPKTEYDKDTDTITITVDPAKTDYQYSVLKKVDGIYQPVTLTKDSTGNYVFDDKSTTVWSDGGQGVVTFTKLPADGTYRIVAIPCDEKANGENPDDIDPSTILDGTKEIDASKIKADATKGDNNTPTTTAPSYTKAEEDKAEKFIKDYVTDTKKKLITKVNDSTRDIIISGESTWKKMTAREKAAVNAKLKAKGCSYTYEQLLQMAKKWKIPSFNMRKLMKKGTKSKIKMIKCKGATIITTTTNKKVATISKKGVIKAKKVGKANLTITAVKGKYTNRLVVRLIVKKKFKNAKEIKKLKAKQIKTPTLLLNKQRKLNKSTKIGIVDLDKKSKVKYKSFNKKNFTINKKGRYKAKRLGSSLIRTTVKQNNKTYILYLYLTGIK